jgi:hypothetical protein
MAFYDLFVGILIDYNGKKVRIEGRRSPPGGRFRSLAPLYGRARPCASGFGLRAAPRRLSRGHGASPGRQTRSTRTATYF